MSNKLFVGNLSFNTTENDLQEAFAAHGTVVEANLMMDRMSGRSRGFAFVTMSTPVIIHIFKKDTFLTKSRVAGSSNFSFGNRMPLWWYGSGDAGNYGSVHRTPTPQQLSLTNPKAFRFRRRKENMSAIQDPTVATSVSWMDVYSDPVNPDCAVAWDEAAAAEAQGLAQVGSYIHDEISEPRFYDVINAGDDGGLSEQELQSLVQTGDAS